MGYQTYAESCSIFKSAAFTFILKILVYLYVDQTLFLLLICNSVQYWMLHSTLVKSQECVEIISILAFSPEKCIDNAIKTFWSYLKILQWCQNLLYCSFPKEWNCMGSLQPKPFCDSIKKKTKNKWKQTNKKQPKKPQQKILCHSIAFSLHRPIWLLQFQNLSKMNSSWNCFCSFTLKIARTPIKAASCIMCSLKATW